jgi:hypothetical protein
MRNWSRGLLYGIIVLLVMLFINDMLFTIPDFLQGYMCCLFYFIGYDKRN